MSQSPPTSIGDTNIAKPEKVRSEPQTTATLSGVMTVFLHRPCSTTIGYCQKLSLMQLQRDGSPHVARSADPPKPSRTDMAILHPDDVDRRVEHILRGHHFN